MKRMLKIFMFPAVMLLLTSCPESSGNSDKLGVTQLDLCKKLWGAYCDASLNLGCDNATQCRTQKFSDCNALFDGTCKASAEDQEKVDHDIEMIINSKTDCNSLTSIESYEEGTVNDLRNSCSGNSGGDADADADADIEIDPDLNITDSCQTCIQTECPGMHEACKEQGGCTGFVNEICDCACNASDDFLGLFVCLMVSASDNLVEADYVADGLGTCISDPGAPCASACSNFGCECSGGGLIDDCNFCVAEKCMDQSLVCLDNIECVAIIDCVSGCADSTCIDGCGEAHPNGVDDFVVWFACISDDCNSDCL